MSALIEYQNHQPAPITPDFNGVGGYQPSQYAEVEIDMWQHFDVWKANRRLLMRLYAKRKNMSFNEFRIKDHTCRTYRQNLKIFLAWLRANDSPFPDEYVMQRYIAWLRTPNQRYQAANGKTYRTSLQIIQLRQNLPAGHILSTNSIGAYLAPVREWLRLLRAKKQPIVFSNDPREMFAVLQLKNKIDEAKEDLKSAIAYKPSEVIDTRHSHAPLDMYGNRVSQKTLLTILKKAQGDTLEAKRNYAILLWFIFTGIRIDSLWRIQMNFIEEGNGSTYILKMKHKRNKVYFVYPDELVILATKEYVRAYNEAVGTPRDLTCDRRIHDDMPIWRALKPHDRKPFADIDRANKPLGQGGVRKIVKTHMERVGVDMTPHDFRRSLAKILRDLGTGIDVISSVLGHANQEVTWRYVGKPQNAESLNVANIEGFWLKEQLTIDDVE